jgi:protein-tyrosine-phosphatase
MSDRAGVDYRIFDILFVCLGNLCRSPMAEGIARDLVATEYPGLSGRIGIASAGVAAMDGEPATPEAVRAMRARGIDISLHRSRRATPEIVDSSDLVLVMEDRHSERLMMAGATGLVFLLTRLGEAAGEVLKAPDDTISASGIPPRIAGLTAAAEAIDRESLWALPDYEYDVPDPIGLPVDGYTAVASRIERPIRDIFSVLLSGSC